jgi:hypothetical protein
MEIVPFDEAGNPIDGGEIPVVIDNLIDEENQGSCGIANAEGEYWEWILTSLNGSQRILDPWTGFGGQHIQGCCIDNISQYTLCEEEFQRTLFFPSGYLREYESIIFREDGTYSRVTRETYANPDPGISDFCGNGQGVVISDEFNQGSEGTWKVDNRAVQLNNYGYETRDFLEMTQTSAVPAGGFANRGGIIHQLNCKVNSLVLWVRDREGAGNDTYNFYQRSRLDSEAIDQWYSLP